MKAKLSIDQVFERGFGGRAAGMLNAKAVVVNARGVALGEAFPREIFDHQMTYMATWLKMLGIEDIHQIEVEKILMGDDAAEDLKKNGREAARNLAREL